MKKPWLWNINKTETEIKKILADPGHAAFVHYAALLFSRHTGLPKEIFGTYIRKEDFCRTWPAIKRRMRKDKWNDERIPFWDGAHEYLVREFKKKGVIFPREKKAVVREPSREKAALAIKEKRRAQKMTQAELAKKMGVTQQFIAKVESGTQNLSMNTLQKIEKALGAKPYEYSAESLPAEPPLKVTEPGPQGSSGKVVRHPEITTWFTEDPERRTESQ